ncbi:PREDICTED: macrophage mannose receptor 1-like [Crocodylus porosus]|uniref:macrophage mannose receptor 1-like n=1 Tax=Crocodylus porosus TaxID=8502 RepID=UPI00093FA8CE|nr:PREDICTED: macrophage mannose receptor 1-like [Crocodylus porosus]
MAVYLFLIFISFISTSLQLPDSEVFLIHNEDNKLCVQAQNGNSLVTTICNQNNELQKFRWISDHQLLNMKLKLCVAVPSKKNQVMVTLGHCNKTNELQQWNCRNESRLAIHGEELFFNYGKGKETRIRLSKESGIGSMWKIYGTTDSLCSQHYEDIFTLLGNSFGAPCVFPFKYKNKLYATCTKDGSDFFSWCATSANYDEDSLYGYCPEKDTTADFFWVTNSLTGIHYQINSESALTWHQARKSCQQQNAELLSITELHEQTYVAGLVSKMNTEIWIGLNSVNDDSGWQWIGGDPFRYLNWAPGSPSPESEKICATLQSKNGKWANQACGHKCGYSCKKGNSSLDSFIIPTNDYRPIKCPKGWMSYAGYCYMIYREPKIWKDAVSSCRKEEGDLASIHDIEEHSFAMSQLGYESTDVLWIGLNDLKIQMYFEWCDGTPVTYAKWLQREPSHINHKQEDCVVMKGEDGYWADDDCEKKFGYICKRKPLAEEPGEAEIIDQGCQKGWKRHGFYCYLVGQVPATFSEAKQMCENNKAFLVTVQDRYEQAFLTSQIGHRPTKYFWIGLSDVEEQGTFKWANGDKILFTHWNSGMPGREAGCVVMRTGTAAGLWDVLSCEQKTLFLCKQLVQGATPPPPPTTAPPLSCPEEWVSSTHSSLCFKLFSKERKYKKSWFEARDFCRAVGGDLAAIHTEEEQNVIVKLRKGSYSSSYYWMGFNNLDPDKGYTWSDGSAVSYENWAEGEPNNYGGNEKCGVFYGYSDMEWNDVFCENMNSWACQIQKGASLKPEPSNTFEDQYILSEDGWILYNEKEYYFSKEKMFMEQAREFCKKNHGDLLVIENESENKFLWKYTYYYGFYDDLYIGLYVSLDKKFRWMDGTLVNYVAWAPNEPNFANNDENCVVMYFRTGMWNDLNCGVSKFFICERLNRTVRSTVAPTSPVPLGGCPENWLLFNNKCFKLFDSIKKEAQSWHAARTTCISLGGNLVTVSSAELQAFLITLIKDATDEVWIGMNDINHEYLFLWTDGSGVSYTNWANGYPDYSYQSDCIFMTNKNIEEAGKWKDSDCQANKSYICQRNTDPKLHRQTTVPIPGFIQYGNSSYSIISSKKNWEEAHKNCKAEHSELASILDAYTQSFLWLHTLKFKEPVWIGLNSNVTGGFYKWTDNWKLKYQKWAPEEPKKKTACVYLDVDGSWKTGSCDEEHFSVCKRSDVMPPPDPPQFPGKCPAEKKGRSWIPFRGHCYYIYVSSKENWSGASMECVRLGSSLATIEDSAEMNFLFNHLHAFASDSSQFWIGMYKNVDDEWTWINNKAVDFVNWKEGEPSTFSSKNCVFMDASDGCWRVYYCSFDRHFICKMPKIPEVEPTKLPQKSGGDEKIEAAPTHRLSGMVVTLAFLILVGVGLTVYFLYRRRNQQQTDTGFGNSLYQNRVTVSDTNESNNLVANIEQNEQDIL